MKRGDVVLVELPWPTRPGREQSGLRPAAVVQIDLCAPPATTVVVIPATSNTAALRFAYTVLVNPDDSNGLDRTSVLLASQVRAVDRARLRGVIGRLSPNDMQGVDDQLKRLLGFAE